MRGPATVLKGAYPDRGQHDAASQGDGRDKRPSIAALPRPKPCRSRQDAKFTLHQQPVNDGGPSRRSSRTVQSADDHRGRGCAALPRPMPSTVSPVPPATVKTGRECSLSKPSRIATSSRSAPSGTTIQRPGSAARSAHHGLLRADVEAADFEDRDAPPPRFDLAGCEAREAAPMSCAAPLARACPPSGPNPPSSFFEHFRQTSTTSRQSAFTCFHALPLITAQASVSPSVRRSRRPRRGARAHGDTPDRSSAPRTRDRASTLSRYATKPELPCAFTPPPLPP